MKTAQTHWSDVWVAFWGNFSHEPPVIQIAILLGIGLIVAMTLEGLHATLFPERHTRHRSKTSDVPGVN